MELNLFDEQLEQGFLGFRGDLVKRLEEEDEIGVDEVLGVCGDL